MNKRLRRRKMMDKAFIIGAFVCVAVAIVPLASILFEVVSRGAPVINATFLTQTGPKPIGEDGGVANGIVGTLVVVGLAVLLSLPIGLFAGIYVAEFGNNHLGASIRFLSEILSGVPSIVMGVFVYATVVISMGHFSAIAGGIVLGLMAIPVFARTSEEAIRSVPVSFKEASLSLGVPYWKTTMKVTLPAAKAGIATGGILATSRIMGEAAPLMLTAFGSQYWSSGVNEPIASLPQQVFVFSISPFPEWQSLAWGAALVLISMVLVMNIATRVITRQKY